MIRGYDKMESSFEKIQKNLEHAEFQFEVGNIFSLERYLTTILCEMKKNKWFFKDDDLSIVNDLKEDIVAYKLDKRKVIANNKITDTIKIKNVSTKLNKNIGHNQQIYNKYLERC